MQNYYHSQYDNQDVYQEPVYRFHHECYLKLVLAYDRLILPPLNFSNTIQAAASNAEEKALDFAVSDLEGLRALFRTAASLGQEVYQKICQVNKEYSSLASEQDRKISPQMGKHFPSASEDFSQGSGLPGPPELAG